MSDENKHEDHVNLELSLGLPQEQVPEEEHGQGQLVPQQNPVEEHGQGQFMQHVRSSPPQNIQPFQPSEHHMTFPMNVPNMTSPWYYVAAPAQQPFPPPPSLLEATPSPSGQLLHLPQANQLGTVATQPPRRGRPPARNGNHGRRNSSRAREIVPPYPWATKKPGVIHTLSHLISKNINVISGQVYCRSCDKTETLEYNLWEKFEELSGYIKGNEEVMRQRAPSIWMDSKLTTCGTCKSEMKPVICENKEEINWLFLFLGQMLGCCTLDQLRFFCESTSKHRTGAKDRVLYLTYDGLYKQLRGI